MQTDKITVIRNAIVNISALLLVKNDEKYACNLYH